MVNTENSLLVEKYRPNSLDNYVGNENIKSVISKYLEQNDIQNFIFYGPAGTGKTTLAKLIINNLDCDYIYINASDERGIETIRDKVSGFASVASFKSLKVVILDEADFLTIQAQASLRNIIETFSRTTRFILTCNFIERIIDPLQSRCQVLKIVPPSKKEVAYHLSDIMDKENISFEMDDLGSIVKQFYPDLRKCINTIQANTVDLKLKLDKSILVSSNYMDKILSELKQNKPSFIKIRQTIADANVDDFDELFRFLYENAAKFLPNKEGTATALINDHQYKANFRIDKEINIMSLINNLIINK
jgi:DNA polymerase III delta prime subunit|tara:strand:- start:1229 stop:2143 length:915 start_codon:yes stop_codon:yes gene_type:complete